jgi:hypothetical protein
MNGSDYEPSLEELYPMVINDEMATIALEFDQNVNWEKGNMPLLDINEEKMMPKFFPPQTWPTGPGIVRLNYPKTVATVDTNPFEIVHTDGVHPLSRHYIFLVRHGGHDRKIFFLYLI